MNGQCTQRDLRMCMGALLLVFLLLLASTFGCRKKSSSESQKELWIYTSVYKDVIADLAPRLEKSFPDVTFHWFQAGSEEVAAKVNAEMLGGGAQADVLLSSDRFWYEELASRGKLHAFRPPSASSVSDELRHKDGYYTSNSHPVMVLAYNQDALAGKQPPKTFREMTDATWKNQFTMASPLMSGTAFSTLAVLQKKYGWDYFKELKKNGMIAEGGNSAVIRRLQSKERAVGAVLLENVLRFKDKDARLKAVFPEDGAVIVSNVLAITAKKGSRELAEKFVEWMFGKEAQEAMLRSYLYSPIPTFAAPEGAPPLATLKSKAFPLTRSFLDEVMQGREKIKETFSQIFFQ